jgi:hypothetical protein
VREALDRIAAVFPSAPLPGVDVLGERAAIAGLAREGPWSCGGSFRTFPTLHGWLGLSLPRPTDLELVPALVGDDEVADPWMAIKAWASTQRTDEALERAILLELACASSREAQPERSPVVTSVAGPRRDRRDRPCVVDLTSLWAGPLCARILGLCGAEVIKVESTRRLDGARSGPAAFFDLLHAGHRMVALDLTDPDDVAALRRLIAKSDLVLEASRARALRRLGILGEDVVAAGTSWLSITAYGRPVDRIGFGDDVAVGAGLYVTDDDEVLPCGDALADPLAGVSAAAAAVEVLAGERAALIDVSMHHVSAETAQGTVEPHVVSRVSDEWWVECDAGRFPVERPTARRPSAAAGRPGRDNDEVLR